MLSPDAGAAQVGSVRRAVVQVGEHVHHDLRLCAELCYDPLPLGPLARPVPHASSRAWRLSRVTA